MHEYGHALDEIDGFDWYATPCTEYARTDRFEAFAEAFTKWVFPQYSADDIKRPTAALFEQWAFE